MEDIAPGLLEKVTKTFERNIKAAGLKQKAMIQKARDGTLKTITEYSGKVGEALAKAFAEEITPDVLPDGILYYNIANQVIIPPVNQAYVMVSDVADEIQATNNAKAGIGLKPIRPPLEKDRIKGLIDLVTDGSMKDNAHFLDEPVKNLVNHFGDNHMEKNAEFLEGSGVEVTVTRTAEATCCAWCAERAGVYDSFEEAFKNEAFARHDGCQCEVEVTSRKGSGKMGRSGHGFIRSGR